VCCCGRWSTCICGYCRGGRGVGACPSCSDCISRRSGIGGRVGNRWCIGGGRVEIGDGIDDAVALVRAIASGIAGNPVGRGAIEAGVAEVEPGPFGGFGDLVVDVIDGDGQAALVVAGNHAAIIIAGRDGNQPYICSRGMAHTSSTVDARRNRAEGKVTVGDGGAIDEGQRKGGARRYFAVDADIERGWGVAFTGTTVTTGAEVNNRFEADIDIVEEVFGRTGGLDAIEAEVFDAAKISWDGVGTIKAHPVEIGGRFDLIAGINGIDARRNTGGGGTATCPDTIDALGNDATIGVCGKRAGI